MDQNVVRTDLLPETMQLWIIAVLAVFGIGAWVCCHWAVKRYLTNKFNVWYRALFSIPLGTIASWLVLQTLGRMMFLATHWSLFFGSILSAFSIEAVSAFYAHECARVPPRIAKILVACRMAAVAIVLLVLMQPVIISDRDREVKQRVVILIDDSASMHFSDRQLTDDEKKDITEALGLNAFPKNGMTRAEMVRQLLHRGGENAFLKKIREKFHVDIFRFGNGIRRKEQVDDEEMLSASEKMFRSVTDLAKALELVVKNVPAEEITAILIFTDGRHNGDAGVESIARRLGGYGIKVNSVVVGGSIKPFDIAISSVDARESVFLGDKIRFSVTVSATGANGKKGRIAFKNEKGDQLDEQDFTIEGNEWAKEFRFVDLPKEQGVYQYSFDIKPVAGELFDDNNSREMDVAVSDDRTNVLLVDGRPRWEYRYLRNLFYGRDKSVHLQDWIVHPDMVFGVPVKIREPASASRPFGDSEAGEWPVQDNDWRQFDVIIIGDVDESVFTDEAIQQLKYNVEERGTLLVFIAGSEYMPMTYKNPALRDLMPIEYTPDGQSHRVAPENDFVFQLTAAGRGHPVMSQSSSSAENEEIWQNIPDFHWRLPIQGVKPGADVLAYAKPRGEDGKVSQLAAQAETIAASIEDDPEAALKRLEEMRSEQARHALVVSQMKGKGRVLMLTTDNMWRLRSKAGDQLHHRFWGQVMRWGAGEKLRTGNHYVRIGTDQLRYGAGEPIKAFARFLDDKHNGLNDLKPKIMLIPPEASSGRTYSLRLRPDSNGFYECDLPGCAKPGVYRLRLECPAANERLGRRMPPALETSFVVVTTKRPAEEVDITSTRNQVERIAASTGGKVLKPTDYIKLSSDLGGGSKTLSDRVEYQLWSTPPLFILVILLVTAEWVLRKRSNLS